MPARRSAILIFLLIAGCGLVPAAVYVFTHDKLAMHAAINERHYAITDLFFRLVTHLGDGLVPTAMALYFLWRGTWRAFMMVGTSAALSAIVAQTLKRQFFADMDRPFLFVDRMPGIDLVQGLELHHHFSFPSGHSTAAFATALALVVLFPGQRNAFIGALTACLIGFSRIYLSQHFTVDVVGGALIGSFTALVVWWWLFESAFARKQWLDRAPFRKANGGSAIQN